MVRAKRKTSESGNFSFRGFVTFARNLFKMKIRRKRRIESDLDEVSSVEDIGSAGDDLVNANNVNASICSVTASVSSLERKKHCNSPNMKGKTCDDTEGCLMGHHVRVAIGRKHSNKNSKSWVCTPCPLGDIWIGDWHTTKFNEISEDTKTEDHTGDKVIEKLKKEGYCVKRQLDNGNFGCRFLAHHSQLNCDVIVKILNCNTPTQMQQNRQCASKYLPRAEDRIEKELEFHRMLNHPALVETISTFSSDLSKALITEFCELGSLENILLARPGKILTETISWRYFSQMLSVITYFHDHNIVHLDLNCKIFEVNCYDRVKLCDLSSARKHFLTEPPYVISCGTYGYQSPEVVRRIPSNPRLVDIWALGVILFIMVTGKFPFQLNVCQGVLIKGKPCFPEERVLPLSSEVMVLLSGIFNADPKERYSLRRVCNCEWMQKKETEMSIGNFHLLQKPRKLLASGEEEKLKSSFGI